MRVKPGQIYYNPCLNRIYVIVCSWDTPAWKYDWVLDCGGNDNAWATSSVILKDFDYIGQV